jgi:hypothetical protein
MIGAEIEHERKKWNGGGIHPRPIGSAVEGFTRRTPPVRAIAQSGACWEPAQEAGELFFALRKLSPPSRKISEFSTRRSAMAVAMVVL